MVRVVKEVDDFDRRAPPTKEESKMKLRLQACQGAETFGEKGKEVWMDRHLVLAILNFKRQLAIQAKMSDKQPEMWN